MDSLIESGMIVVLALVFLVVETIVLLGWRRRRGGAIPLRSLLVNAGAGGSLMLALGAALVELGPAWVAAALLLSLGFHLADLAVRWERTPPA